MTRRWGLVGGITIQAVVEQDCKPQVPGDWQELSGAFGPGDVVVDGQSFRAGSPELQAYLEARTQKGGT